jgi:hypothetical protein
MRKRHLYIDLLQMFAWDHICANFGKPGRLTHHAILRKMLNVPEVKLPNLSYPLLLEDSAWFYSFGIG